MKIILMFGPAGSGKGTQAQILATKFGIVKISPGDILRSIAQGSVSSTSFESVKRRIADGKLVKPEVINSIMMDEIRITSSRADTLLLDGYPRDIAQDNFLREEIVSKANVSGVLAIHLKIETDKLFSRLAARSVCQNCNTIYNKADTPNDMICTACHSGNIIMRDDDKNEDAVKKRFDIFRMETCPVIERYESDGNLIVFDADQDVSILSNQITDAIKGYCL